MKTMILSLLLVMAAPSGVFAQSQPAAPPTLRVTGTASLQAAPDRAIVRLGVTRQSTSAQSAQDQANKAAQDILDAVTRIGVAPNQIQTSRLTLSPIYSQQRPGSNDPPRIVAYNASNVVAITIEDLAKVGPALDAGLNAGANRLEGVVFDLKNDLPVRTQALRQAVSEARSKAEAMADSLGVRLVEVLEVSEGGVSVMPRFMEQHETFARAAMAPDIAPTPVNPGQLDVQASVTLSYRIGERQ